jgi:hypothetical protein
VITFEDKRIASPQVTPDCRSIVAAFPPTTLGQFNQSDLSYYMEFSSGVSFQFRIRDKATFDQFSSRRDHPVSLGDTYSPIVRAVIIKSPSELSTEEKIASLPRFEIHPLEAVSLRIPGDDCPVWIKLGSGLQDVMSAIGLPEDQFNGILNYYRYGLDIVTDPERLSVVTGIILHTNPPGHVVAGRYARTWFTTTVGKRKSREVLDNTSSIAEWTAAFGEPGQPLVVSNNSPRNIQYFYTFSGGICVETNPEGIVASVQVSSLNI